MEDVSDIRSPFITILLSLFLKAGGTIGLLTLVQCVTGFLGVRRLSLATTSLFPIEKPRQEWIACFLQLLLSSPLTPMPVYFATFWLDTWLAIFLLWAAALLLELAKETSVVISASDWVKLFFLAALIAFIMLTRLNAPILYPALTVAFLSVQRQKSIPGKVLPALTVFPLLFYLAFTFLQYEIIGVKHAHQERIVLALDLASMLTYNPAICETLELQSCSVVLGRLSPGFVVGRGAIDHTLNQGLSTMEPAFVELAFSSSLFQDTWQVAIHHPETYAAVKVLNFLDYTRPRDRYYYQAFMHPNGLNLYFNTRFEYAREMLFTLLHAVYEHPLLKFFSFVHLPWILINLVGIIFCFLYRRPTRQLRILGTLLFIPATYYGSYLLALTASDFRFMYPAMLLVQVILISVVPAWWAASVGPRQPTSILRTRSQ